jgi:hypothetical protein
MFFEELGLSCQANYSKMNDKFLNRIFKKDQIFGSPIFEKDWILTRKHGLSSKRLVASYSAYTFA